MIIDNRGYENDTCLVCKGCFPYREDEDEDEDEDDEEDDEETEDNEKPDMPYRMARIAFTNAWNMYNSLDSAILGFEDYIDVNAGIQDDGAWKGV